MGKKRKSKRRKSDPLLDIVSTGVKASVALGVANTVINATRR